MQAQMIMRTDYVSLKPEQSVLEAAALLVERRLHAAPVVDDDGRLLGVLSVTGLIGLALPGYLDEVEDLSFLPASFELPSGLPELTAGELCARQPRPQPYGGPSGPPAVAEGEPLLEVARILVREGAWQCAVTREGRVAGVIDPLDLLAALLAQ